jgi:hypothetical protein
MAPDTFSTFTFPPFVSYFFQLWPARSYFMISSDFSTTLRAHWPLENPAMMEEQAMMQMASEAETAGSISPPGIA